MPNLKIGQPILRWAAKLRILKWANDNLKIGEKKVPNFQNSHFQCIFNDFGFLVDITLKLISKCLHKCFMLVGHGQRSDYVMGMFRNIFFVPKNPDFQKCS